MKSLLRSAFIAAAVAFIFILLGPVNAFNPVEARPASVILFELPASTSMFMPGEELQYNVSYSVFDIGLVKMTIIDSAYRNGVKVFKGKAYLDSYSGLPFVDLHQVFYSEMDEEAFSQFFITHNTSKPEKMGYVKYTYEYDKNKFNYEFGTDPGGVVTKSGEGTVSERNLDGLSLFYYARLNFLQVKKFSVPVLVSEKSYKTHFNFMNKLGEQDIDAVKYPVETVEFDGTSDFTGVFGLTGYFRGFFSNDEAGIPIVAKMKVILGSVHIELIKWNRPGWAPPKAK
ncbi:MAG: DUF3108 domain-containing protein [Bacteroidetes bacterium]|nr:DUF3108 domain-containing protein [Bacteroidota bacterium]